MVFKRVNGVVEVEDVRLKEVLDGRLITRWYGKKYEEGRFMYELVLLGGRVYIVEEWIPEYGYSWAELNVYELTP